MYPYKELHMNHLKTKFLYKIYMLCHDRTDAYKEIDVNRTSESKKYDICHNWYILNKGFKFQPNVCSGWNNLLMIFMNFSDIAVLNIKSADYRFISGIIKSS